jgi:hypothetical protein
MVSRKNKNDKIPPHTLYFLVSYCCWALKYHAGANFFTGGRETSKIELPWFLVNVAVNACQNLATLLRTGEEEGDGGGRKRHCQKTKPSLPSS